MQAVIKAGSGQLIVSPGQEFLIDKLKNSDSQITFTEVLLFIDNGKSIIGTPFIPGYSVKAEVLGPAKGEKIRVFKFKAKSRYRKHTGFRAQYSRIKILSVDTPDTEVKKTAPASPPEVLKTKSKKIPVKSAKRTPVTKVKK